MANVSVYNMEGKEVGTMELNDAVFGVEINDHLVHLAVVRQLANNRQGTQKAKTRSEVSGGGRKPWRQKGTGHARQGSTRSPQWAGMSPAALMKEMKELEDRGIPVRERLLLSEACPLILDYHVDRKSVV